jgi:hypothetical protein
MHAELTQTKSESPPSRRSRSRDPRHHGASRRPTVPAMWSTQVRRRACVPAFAPTDSPGVAASDAGGSNSQNLPEHCDAPTDFVRRHAYRFRCAPRRRDASPNGHSLRAAWRFPAFTRWRADSVGEPRIQSLRLSQPVPRKAHVHDVAVICIGPGRIDRQRRIVDRPVASPAGLVPSRLRTAQATRVGSNPWCWLRPTSPTGDAYSVKAELGVNVHGTRPNAR